MNCIAGILVGGESRRMGRAKALLPMGDASLLERIHRVALRAAGHVVLLGEPPFELPPALKTTRAIPDRTPGVGPIGGLDALLQYAADPRALLIACDMPNLTETLLLRLVDAPMNCDAVVPLTADGRRHPCCAAYAPSALSAVRDAIAAGSFAMHDLLGRLRVQTIGLSCDEAKWVDNWNEPADIPNAAASKGTTKGPGR